MRGHVVYFSSDANGKDVSKDQDWDVSSKSFPEGWQEKAANAAGSLTSDNKAPRVLLRRPRDPNEKVQTKVSSGEVPDERRRNRSTKQKQFNNGGSRQNNKPQDGKEWQRTSRGGSRLIPDAVDWDPKVPRKLASFDELSRAFSNKSETPPLKGGAVLPPVPVVAPLPARVPIHPPLLVNGVKQDSHEKSANNLQDRSNHNRPPRPPTRRSTQASHSEKELRKQKKERRLRQKEEVAKRRLALEGRSKGKKARTGTQSARSTRPYKEEKSDSVAPYRDTKVVSEKPPTLAPRPVSKPVTKDLSFSDITKASIRKQGPAKDDSSLGDKRNSAVNKPMNTKEPSSTVESQKESSASTGINNHTLQSQKMVANGRREESFPKPERDVERRNRRSDKARSSKAVTPAQKENERQQDRQLVPHTRTKGRTGRNDIRRNDAKGRPIWKKKPGTSTEDKSPARAHSPKSVVDEVHATSTESGTSKLEEVSTPRRNNKISRKRSSTRLRGKFDGKKNGRKEAAVETGKIETVESRSQEQIQATPKEKKVRKNRGNGDGPIVAKGDTSDGREGKVLSKYKRRKGGTRDTKDAAPTTPVTKLSKVPKHAMANSAEADEVVEAAKDMPKKTNKKDAGHQNGHQEICGVAGTEETVKVTPLDGAETRQNRKSRDQHRDRGASDKGRVGGRSEGRGESRSRSRGRGRGRGRGRFFDRRGGENKANLVRTNDAPKHVWKAVKPKNSPSASTE